MIPASTRAPVPGTALSHLVTRTLAALALLPLLIAVPAGAQPAPLAGLDAYVERAMADWEVPGLSLAVIRGDSVIHAEGYGVTRLGGDDPVDEHTLFAIASTTKAFTVGALGALVDEGRLDWDDPVAEHLPGFRLQDPYVSAELKVRDLLTHRVGVARMDNIWIAAPFDRDEILRRARHLPHVDGFREEYNYNNILYIVAGELAGRVAGTSWDDLVESRLFGPLGMDRSTTRAAEVEKRSNVAHSHTRVDGEVQAVPRRNYDAIGGAGAVWSSAAEMARWVRLHLGRGVFQEERLLSEEALEEMYRPHTPMSIDTASARLHPTNHFRAYAMGWRVQDLHARKLVHHSGSINYTRTQVTMVPEEGIGVVVFANLSSSNLQLALTHWILDALQGREPRDWSGEYLELAERSRSSSRSGETLEEARLDEVGPSLPLEDYAGDYEDELFGPVRLDMEDGGLVLRYSPAYEADLEHWHQDVFRAHWRRPGAGRTFVRFTIDPRANVTAASLDGFATFRRVDER